jgi:phosphatidylserine decarboxylase
MFAQGRSIIVGEGWPLLIASLAVTGVVFSRAGPLWSLLPLMVTGWLYLLFRDPLREVPPLPLAVVAPVDGRVISTARVTDQSLPGSWLCVTIRAHHLGAYTVRAPIEGTILDVREKCRGTPLEGQAAGMWLRSEEGDDVVLQFRGPPLFSPKTFVRYGERVGQGARFAYLRLTPIAEVYLPISSHLRVEAGQRVTAGSGVIAELVHA